MKRFILLMTVVFISGAAQTASAAEDHYDFVLTAQPPAGAMKYQFLFDPADQRAGNAALQYDVALLLWNADAEKQLEAAEDALNRHDDARFIQLAEKVQRPSIMTELDLAGRRTYCQWETPTRELGINTLLPRLQTLRALAELTGVEARRQMRTGDIDGAVASLRLGYELARKQVEAPDSLVGALVGNGMFAVMADATTELMNRPDSPNLYWAFAGLPRPALNGQLAMQAERLWLAATFPELQRRDELTAAEWHKVFDEAVEQMRPEVASKALSQRGWENPNTVADEVRRQLPQAQAMYTERRHTAPEDVEKLDAFQVVAWMWYQQYQDLVDEQYALAGLPFSTTADAQERYLDKVKQATLDNPANVFLEYPSSIKALKTFVQLDRTIAALTDVEAIRSYAAAHDGALPTKLSDIIDTPTLPNPRTGKPFDYSIRAGAATLSDPAPAEFSASLRYTITIRK